MTHACYFGPLSPSSEYPTSPYSIWLADRQYDLPIPSPVAKFFVEEAGSLTNQFFRRTDLCCPAAILPMRADSRLLYGDSGRAASYAEVIARVSKGSGGYVAQFLFVTKELCATLVLKALEDLSDTGSRDVKAFVEKRLPYFTNCGGFELLLGWHYFDEEEREQLVQSGIIHGDFRFEDYCSAVLSEMQQGTPT